MSQGPASYSRVGEPGPAGHGLASLLTCRPPLWPRRQAAEWKLELSFFGAYRQRLSTPGVRVVLGGRDVGGGRCRE